MLPDDNGMKKPLFCSIGCCVKSIMGTQHYLAV